MNTEVLNWRSLIEVLDEKGVTIATEDDKIVSIYIAHSSLRTMIKKDIDKIEVPKYGTLSHSISSAGEEFVVSFTITGGEIIKLYLKEKVYLENPFEIEFENTESRIFFQMKSNHSIHTSISNK